MIKHTKPFLGIDYDLLAITSLVINGKTKEVKLHHKIIYSYLLSLSGTYQKVTPSLKGIGERLGVGTDQTVRRHIKDLVSFGWLKIEERAGSTNAYIVLPYEQEAQTQQEATVKTVPDQLPLRKIINSLLLMFLMMIGIRLYHRRRKKHLFHQVKR